MMKGGKYNIREIYLKKNVYKKYKLRIFNLGVLISSSYSSYKSPRQL